MVTPRFLACDEGSIMVLPILIEGDHLVLMNFGLRYKSSVFSQLTPARYFCTMSECNQYNFIFSELLLDGLWDLKCSTRECHRHKQHSLNHGMDIYYLKLIY